MTLPRKLPVGPALRHVLAVGGRRASYKFKRFQY
jgi:hypothetical protein